MHWRMHAEPAFSIGSHRVTILHRHHLSLVHENMIPYRFFFFSQNVTAFIKSNIMLSRQAFCDSACSWQCLTDLHAPPVGAGTDCDRISPWDRCRQHHLHFHRRSARERRRIRGYFGVPAGLVGQNRRQGSGGAHFCLRSRPLGPVGTRIADSAQRHYPIDQQYCRFNPLGPQPQN